jgi:WbqC-like protein family
MEVVVGFSEEFHQKSDNNILNLRNSILPKAHKTKDDLHFVAPVYNQVFEDRLGFLPNLSALDLLFCCGPQALFLLRKSII